MTPQNAHLDRIATELQDLVAVRGDGWLTAARIRVPEGSDWPERRWTQELTRRLADRGIDQVDIHVCAAAVPTVELDRAAFDAGWS